MNEHPKKETGSYCEISLTVKQREILLHEILSVDMLTEVMRKVFYILLLAASAALGWYAWQNTGKIEEVTQNYLPVSEFRTLESRHFAVEIMKTIRRNCSRMPTILFWNQSCFSIPIYSWMSNIPRGVDNRRRCIAVGTQ